MKKDNPMLKKALEEAARQELSSLPEERQIIRPYSDKFEKDMQTLLGKADTAETRKRPRVRVAALIAAVLVVVLTAGVVGATDGFKIFSPEWRESIQEAAKNATYSDEVAEFDEAFAKADDYFANLTRKTEGASDVLLDYSDSYDLDITAEKDGYTFYVDKIVKGKYKHNKCISGNPIKGTGVFQWVIENRYYLLVEVSRTDGKKWTEEDKETWFDLSVVSADFSPLDVQACLRGGYGISEREEYTGYFLMDVTEAMCFANHDLGLVIQEYPNDFGAWISYEEVYLDEDNLPAFRDHIEGTNLVIKFNVDKKFADEEKVQAYAKEYGVDLNLDLYKK